jgi:hypothetical protein
MDTKGHITDDEFEELGYPRDVNSKGVEVRREAGMTAENSQRAKILSHLVQRNRRRALISEKKAAEARPRRPLGAPRRTRSW